MVSGTDGQLNNVLHGMRSNAKGLPKTDVGSEVQWSHLIEFNETN